ncbi:MAG: hypothetical protein WKF45_09800 [Ilumatobacteraceae bacterium]
MIKMTIELDDDLVEKLEARAAEEGTTVPLLVARILDAAIYDLTPEQEEQLIESAAQADRGEVVSEEEAMAALRALSRR